MKIIKGVFLTLVLAMLLIQTSPAFAGSYTDDLTKCIVESTTTKERAEFVKWVFSAVSLHPAVESISSVSKKQLEETNKKTAQLFMRLLTDSCMQKAKMAIRYEGRIAIQSSFQILGQMAGQELFSSPGVTTAMKSFTKHFDAEKLESLLVTE